VGALTWVLVCALYFALLWTAGVATFRRGHYAMFFAGIVLPVVWLVGIFIPPTPDVAAAREARRRQQFEGPADERGPGA
jgi:hypothetical protein